MHGAGVIEDIVEQKINGTARRYYVLTVPAGNVTVLIPVMSSDCIGVRPVIGSDAADEVLAEFKRMEVDDAQNWNRRYRENMTRLKSGDLGEVSKVVKSLMVREKQRSLSTGERKMLCTAKQILMSELVLAKKLSYDIVESMLLAVL